MPDINFNTEDEEKQPDINKDEEKQPDIDKDELLHLQKSAETSRMVTI